MKECVDCSSTNVVLNCNTNKIFCYDCKSKNIYGSCYECGEPIRDEGTKGHDGWHDNNKKYKINDNPELVSCWEWKKFQILMMRNVANG